MKYLVVFFTICLGVSLWACLQVPDNIMLLSILLSGYTALILICLMVANEKIGQSTPEFGVMALMVLMLGMFVFPALLL